MNRSHFFAFFAKLRWIPRWSLKRNVNTETVLEHSAEVAAIAHMLAVLRNVRFGGSVDAGMVTTVALFHDLNEVVTGDMPSPVKYHNPGITRAYKEIEALAQREIHALLPEDVGAVYQSILLDSHIDPDIHHIVKAADTISAYFKCRMEVSAGNSEFTRALEDLHGRVERLTLPEVPLFLSLYADSLGLTLDELMTPASLS
jgi:5'-deoxynucleotidase